jgi:hypothetical protein
MLLNPMGREISIAHSHVRPTNKTWDEITPAERDKVMAWRAGGLHSPASQLNLSHFLSLNQPNNSHKTCLRFELNSGRVYHFHSSTSPLNLSRFSSPAHCIPQKVLTL